MSLATPARLSPCIIVGMLQHCSTTCNPLNTSPSASANVFPCSSVIFSANFFIFDLIMFCRRNKTCCLDMIDVFDQVSYAFFALATAASISAGVDLGTRVTTSLVAGLCRSIQSLVFDSTNLPSMYSLVVDRLRMNCCKILVFFDTTAVVCKGEQMHFLYILRRFDCLVSIF
uniref:Uncharacterized protein n=1 Tax=Cacopsylla melanoneura TaxID=428564 RepID=A0A8D9FDH8_9HEMI